MSDSASSVVDVSSSSSSDKKKDKATIAAEKKAAAKARKEAAKKDKAGDGNGSVDTNTDGKKDDAAAPAEKKDKKEKKEKKEKKSESASASSAVSEHKSHQRPTELPEYVSHRIAQWDLAFKRRAEEAKKAEPKKISIKLPDGAVKEGIAGQTTPLEIASAISKKLAEKSVAAKVNGVVVDLSRPIDTDCELQLLDFDSPEGKHVYWHSSAHVLGQALELEYGDARLCIGPPVDEGGFYYDVHLGETKVIPDDFSAIEELIEKVRKEKQPFIRLQLKKEEALEIFKFNPFKSEIIKTRVPDGAFCTAYRCGPLIDLCKGPHVLNTGVIGPMKVTKASSAYWQARADQPSLQRVYGISFPTKKALEEYEKRIKEAEERDHRRIGVEQKLFFFDDISPGSCFFLPHGARLYNTLISFIRNEYWKRGYTEVISPNMFNIDLWKTSGHYENYKENMFLFEVEKQEFGLKPMNCPGHSIMFRHQQHSYRELPLRYADFGVLHRNELSGALSGLTRVRRFQQDDAHIFCRPDQIEAEAAGVLDMLKHVYGIFGFQFALALSTRPEKHLGDSALWDRAEGQLEKVLNKFCSENGLKWALNKGDGAFYGPKIDIRLTDALGRAIQCATLQMDFNLPIRFDLSYKTADDKFERPVMIHRAILGSVERMIAVLVEHTGGRWPFWLSPRQVIVVPVALDFLDYAQEVSAAVHAAGFFVDLDDSTKQFAKKIFEAQAHKYNLVLVVGAKEKEEKFVTVRYRVDAQDDKEKKVEAQQKTFKLPDLLAHMKELREKFQ